MGCVAMNIFEGNVYRPKEYPTFCERRAVTIYIGSRFSRKINSVQRGKVNSLFTKGECEYSKFFAAGILYTEAAENCLHGVGLKFSAIFKFRFSGYFCLRCP